MSWIKALNFLVTSLAFANDHAHEVAQQGVPKIVLYQAINFGLLLLFLHFFIGKKVRLFFVERHAAFHQALLRAQSARLDAERARNEIRERMNTLDSTADDSIRSAQEEANSVKAQIIETAAADSKNLVLDAQKAIEFETRRTAAAMVEGLINSIRDQARASIQASLPDADKRRLQAEFVDKIQGVNP